MSTIKRVLTSNILSAGTLIYTAPNGKHFLNSLFVTNIYSTSVLVSCEISNGGNTIRLGYNIKLNPGDTININNEKIFLETNDTVVVKSTFDNSVEVIANILEGVQ